MSRKNGIKKLLMYVVVLIGALFVGFTAYYFARNDETFDFEMNQGDIIYLNAGNAEKLPLRHTKPYKTTKVVVTSSNEDVVNFVKETNMLHANSGGVSTITITTTNKNFGPYKFDMFVGDGSIENPWYISSAKQFSKIGTGYQEITKENFASSDAYELINDINLANIYSENSYWTPIPQFNGSLQGEGHVVSNLKIESSTINNVGLFGLLSSSASVENLTLSNVEIFAENAKNVGIVAGVNQGHIGKIKVDGQITSDADFVGGVVGENSYSDSRAVINMVEATVSFKASGKVGGVAGLNTASVIYNANINIVDLFAYDEENVTLKGFGGIAGDNIFVIDTSSTIENGEYRQASIKNSLIYFSSLSILESGDSAPTDKIGLLVYENLNGEIKSQGGHEYQTDNEFKNLKVRKPIGYELSYSINGEIKVNEASNIVAVSDLTLLEVSDATKFGLGENWVKSASLSQRIGLNFEESYENPQVSNPGPTIVDKQTMLDALKEIISSPKTYTYYELDLANFEGELIDGEVEGEKVLEIYGYELTDKQDETIDEQIYTYWIPIGNDSHPYNGTLKVTGGKLIIRNLIIKTPATGELYGLFGSIDGNKTYIQNVGVKNVRINAQVTEEINYAGGFSAKVSQAMLTGISVDGVHINNVVNAGFAFGTVNSGTISNITVGSVERLEAIEAEDDEEGYKFGSSDEHHNLPNKINIEKSFEKHVFLGGIVGEAYVNLQDVTVHYGTISFNGSGQAYIGGAIGKQYAGLKNAYINNGLFISDSNGYGYYGGVSGYMSVGSSIESSFSLANINVLINSDSNSSFAGGITGHISKTSSILYSFSGDSSFGEVRAKNVGGIAAVNYGLISQSYSAGVYHGHNVGGITYINHGEMNNVYTRAVLHAAGTSKNYTVAGITAFLPKGGVARYVFSSANINGRGDTGIFAETRSPFRYNGFENLVNNIASWLTFNVEDEGGTLENYIAINYGKAKPQYGIFGKLFKEGLLETNEEEVKGQGSNSPLSVTGFTDLSPHIWLLLEGEWPELTKVIRNPYKVVEAIEEEA